MPQPPFTPGVSSIFRPSSPSDETKKQKKGEALRESMSPAHKDACDVRRSRWRVARVKLSASLHVAIPESFVAAVCATQMLRTARLERLIWSSKDTRADETRLRMPRWREFYIVVNHVFAQRCSPATTKRRIRHGRRRLPTATLRHARCVRRKRRCPPTPPARCLLPAASFIRYRQAKEAAMRDMWRTDTHVSSVRRYSDAATTPPSSPKHFSSLMRATTTPAYVQRS